MRIPILALFLIHSSLAWGCLAPRIAWTDALQRSIGAIVVVPTKVGSIDNLDLVRLSTTEVISDPRLAGKDRYIVAVDEAGRRDDRAMRSVAFWNGGDTSGRFAGGACQYMQLIDYSKRYLLLLGVDGPYALEPIFSDADDWVGLVKEYFVSGSMDPRRRSVDEFLDGLTGIRAGACAFDVFGSIDSDDFLSCMSTSDGPTIGRGEFGISLDVYGFDVRFQMKSDSLTISAGELRQQLGATFGFDDGVKLFDILNEISRHGRH